MKRRGEEGSLLARPSSADWLTWRFRRCGALRFPTTPFPGNHTGGGGPAAWPGQPRAPRGWDAAAEGGKRLPAGGARFWWLSRGAVPAAQEESRPRGGGLRLSPSAPPTTTSASAGASLPPSLPSSAGRVSRHAGADQRLGVRGRDLGRPPFPARLRRPAAQVAGSGRDVGRGEGHLPDPPPTGSTPSCVAVAVAWVGRAFLSAFLARRGSLEDRPQPRFLGRDAPGNGSPARSSRALQAALEGASLLPPRRLLPRRPAAPLRPSPAGRPAGGHGKDSAGGGRLRQGGPPCGRGLEQGETSVEQDAAEAVFSRETDLSCLESCCNGGRSSAATWPGSQPYRCPWQVAFPQPPSLLPPSQGGGPKGTNETSENDAA